jgi:hypothetical protein
MAGSYPAPLPAADKPIMDFDLQAGDVAVASHVSWSTLGSVSGFGVAVGDKLYITSNFTLEGASTFAEQDLEFKIRNVTNNLDLIFRTHTYVPAAGTQKQILSVSVALSVPSSWSSSVTIQLWAKKVTNNADSFTVEGSSGGDDFPSLTVMKVEAA